MGLYQLQPMNNREGLQQPMEFQEHYRILVDLQVLEGRNLIFHGKFQ